MNKVYCDVCGNEVKDKLHAYIHTKEFGINVYSGATKDISSACQDFRVDVCRDCIYKALKDSYEAKP